ncbi:hypothetical protein JR316_0001583 [Psilocybe cubensis]|uniref:Uncharacterized protein n=1 Tax=Psilocybe cubensis TaxID=181762 RepID=A0ACB8HBV2_PSICU|nr:hypothetical protein JR316_0001583 [Psilocybe cubensis]KAH9484684.1 hypothetical protein JR316_0001583 [Psilocybe cubensis]
MQQFPDAHNLMINGGIFSQTQNNYGTGRDAGLHTLKQHIAADAIYDSAERFPPAQCHPGTRERIIETIMEWIDAPNPEKQALWLYGPAGAGKSAIGHSIAMKLQESLECQRYGSSFFFAKGAPGRGDGNKLFSTIAYELAMNFPEYRAVLDAVMQDNPTLPTKSINVQIQNLLIRPLRKLSNWPSHHPTIIIDGLDECSGEKRMHGAILSTISNTIIQHRIPLRFLIISRPEYWIADAFEIGCFSSVVKRLSLRDDHDADAGIRHYLCDEFNRIYDENIDVMCSIPRPWPQEQIIERFVACASGQFVYASTVIKFVGDSLHCDPLEQLRVLTTDESCEESSAFSELDHLYVTILSTYPRWGMLKRVLGAIVHRSAMSEAVMEHIFDVPPPELRQILRSMRPLIYIADFKCPPLLQRLESTFGPPAYKEEWLSFHHLSFIEFITDDSRSRQYSDTAHIVVQEYQKLHGELDVLLQADTHIPYPNHTLLILSKYRDDLNHLGAATEKKRIEPSNSNRELFKSLLDFLNLAFSASAQQVLKTTPVDGPIFGCLVTQDWSSFPLRMDIAELCATKNITDDAFVSELEKIHGVVTILWGSDSGQLITVPHLFQQEIYGKPNDYLIPGQVEDWEAQILANVASSFVEFERKTVKMDPFRYIQMEHFLAIPRLSDIRSQQCLHNPHKMAILNILIGPHLPQPEYHRNFAIPSLNWFSRHLIGPNRCVIEEFDSTLAGKIEAAAKARFSAMLLLYVQASSHDTNIPNYCFAFKGLPTFLANSDQTYLWTGNKKCQCMSVHVSK